MMLLNIVILIYLTALYYYYYLVNTVWSYILPCFMTTFVLRSQKSLYCEVVLEHQEL